MTYMQELELYQHRKAVSFARAKGFHTYTSIRYDRTRPEGVEISARTGYRKRTTGQYVPNKYLANFGWKNTFYQAAICVINLHP